MKRNQPTHNRSKDTAATRKQRMQSRLQEIADKSEQELAAVMQSIESVKAKFKSDKLPD